MKRRLKFLTWFFSVWTILLIARIFYWQVFRSGSLAKAAAQQYGQSLEIKAERGRILSRDGFPLVENKNTYLLFAEPQKIKLDTSLRRVLEDTIRASDSARQVLQNLDSSDLRWIPVAHYLDEDVKAAVEKLNIVGLGFDPEPRREYPEGSASAYITGLVGKDKDGRDLGYFGLEGYYNRALSGKSGLLFQESDAQNRPIVIGTQSIIQSQPGQDLITTIDRTVEYIAYQKLSEGLQKYGAKSGTVTIMESQTGRILAMVAIPGYDPADFSSYDSRLYKNPIVSDGYEPGSTFKVIVMSSALDAGAVTTRTVCTECDGPKVISGYRVSSYNDHYYPNSTMSDIILHSDNIGMVFVGKKLGKDKLLSYLKKFGIGQLTGIDLQEEDTPALRPDNDWHDIDLATATFGQGVAVTRIQMVTAVNALATGGVLLPPQIVTAIRTGNTSKQLPAPQSRRVVSRQAAAEVVAMMKNGVENGEVRYYRVPGYSVAGKTGTAQVPIAGHYDDKNLIASFVAFAPVENPKFTMLVTLREPQSSPWGSTTAAPLWFSIAGELFRYFQIPPH